MRLELNGREEEESHTAVWLSCFWARQFHREKQAAYAASAMSTGATASSAMPATVAHLRSSGAAQGPGGGDCRAY